MKFNLMNATTCNLRRHCFAIVLSILGVILSSARSERVSMSPEELKKNATHIIVGKVTGIFSKSSSGGGYKRTSYVAEVRIDTPEKGSDIKKGDIVYVRYWQQQWEGPGSPPPGTNGYRDIPKEGETLRIHLVRNGYTGFGNTTDGGFDALGPNGFDREGVKEAK